MQRLIKRLLLIAVLALLPTVSLAETRALLAACSDFITQNDLGSATSGNLHMIGSAFLGISPRLAGLSIEDGTIGTPEALERAVEDAFAEADEDDFSILYRNTIRLIIQVKFNASFLRISLITDIRISASPIGEIRIHIPCNSPDKSMRVYNMTLRACRFDQGVENIRAKLFRFIAVVRSGIAKTKQLFQQIRIQLV